MQRAKDKDAIWNVFLVTMSISVSISISVTRTVGVSKRMSISVSISMSVTKVVGTSLLFGFWSACSAPQAKTPSGTSSW